MLQAAQQPRSTYMVQNEDGDDDDDPVDILEQSTVEKMEVDGNEDAPR